MAGEAADIRHFLRRIRLIANQSPAPGARAGAASEAACSLPAAYARAIRKGVGRAQGGTRVPRPQGGGLRAPASPRTRDPRGGQNRPAGRAAASLSVKRKNFHAHPSAGAGPFRAAGAGAGPFRAAGGGAGPFRAAGGGAGPFRAAGGGSRP
jgi:hypothetical protein